MLTVTQDIRKAIRVKLAENDWTQAELAERADLTPQFVSQVMSGKRGDLPEYWQALLDAAGLELTVKEKK